MESRKYQLQQQIMEALKANDNDLFCLLKSQWAHRFGVESLEELQNLDLTLLDQNTINKDNQKNHLSQDSSFEVDREIFNKDDENDENKENEIVSDSSKLVYSIKVEKKDSLEIKSAEKFDTENFLNNTISPVSENKSLPKVKALIPLPPKPKYGYLKKWLLRS